MNLFVRSVGILAIASALASCGGGGGAASATSPGGGTGGTPGTTGGETCTGGNFCMGSTTFSPTTLTVARGTVVTWSNTSGINHDVTFDSPNSVTGGNIAAFSSGTQSRTFTASGTYHFICVIHGPTMTATLTVQ